MAEMERSALKRLFGDEWELMANLIEASDALNYARLAALTSDVANVDEVIKAGDPVNALLGRYTKELSDAG